MRKCACARAGHSRLATTRSVPDLGPPCPGGLRDTCLGGGLGRVASDARASTHTTCEGARRARAGRRGSARQTRATCVPLPGLVLRERARISDMAVSSPLRAFFANMLLRGDSFFCCFAKGRMRNVYLRCLTCLTGAAELRAGEARETHTRGRWNTHLQLCLCRHRSALSTCGAASLTTS